MEDTDYAIVFLKAALADIEEAVIWYKKNSDLAATRFVKALESRLQILKQFPHRYKKTYKQFYEVALIRFPYSIVYFIEEKKALVVVAAVYHHKRNPRNKFRKPKQ